MFVALAYKVTVDALITVINSFSFSTWDSVDHEELGMGDGQVSTDERVTIEALVTLGGQIAEDMTIESVEILPARHRVELGEVNPDWMNDPDHFDMGEPE